jgi:hypothetical protein
LFGREDGLVGQLGAKVLDVMRQAYAGHVRERVAETGRGHGRYGQKQSYVAFNNVTLEIKIRNYLN